MKKIFTLLLVAASAMAVAQPTTSATAPTEAEADVTSVFSDAYTDIAGTNFNPSWGQATVYSSFNIGTDTMLQYATLNYQGIELGSDVNAANRATLHMDIWSDKAADVAIFLISRSKGERQVTVSLAAGAWTTVDIDLTDYISQGLAVTDIWQFKFDETARTVSPTIYVDNIYFYGTPAATEPIIAASNPYEPAANVISIYSESYMDPAGVNYNAARGQSTQFSEFAIGEDSMIKYANINFQGIELGDTMDFSDMEFMHMDVWTADVDSMDVFLINPGPPVVEKSVVARFTKGAWTSITVPLTAFTDQGMTVDQIYQIKFDSKYTAGGTIFVDNIFFYKVPMPETAAPTPTRAQVDVKSIYSASYTNPANANYYPSWGQSTKFRAYGIGADTMIEYSQLNYQGIEFGETIDASDMDSIHIDVWSTYVTNLDLYLISVANGERPSRIVLEANKWNSVDIALADYTGQGLTLNDLHQIKFVDPDNSNGTVYVDNLYMFKEASASVAKTETASFKVYPNPATSKVVVELANATDRIQAIEIINIQGEVVETVQMELAQNNATVSVENFAKGAYFIRVTSEQGAMTQRIVIK
jgi:hypothetical protein